MPLLARSVVVLRQAPDSAGSSAHGQRQDRLKTLKRMALTTLVPKVAYYAVKRRHESVSRKADPHHATGEG